MPASRRKRLVRALTFSINDLCRQTIDSRRPLCMRPCAITLEVMTTNVEIADLMLEFTK